MNWLSGTFDLFWSFLASLWPIEIRSSCFWELKCTLDKGTRSEAWSYRWLRSPTLLKSSWQSGHTNCPLKWKWLRWRGDLRGRSFTSSSASSFPISTGLLGFWPWTFLPDVGPSRKILLLSWEVDAAIWVPAFDAPITSASEVSSSMVCWRQVWTCTREWLPEGRAHSMVTSGKSNIYSGGT